MSDRIELRKVSAADIRQDFIRKGLIDNAANITELLTVAASVSEDNDTIESWSEFPKLPPNTIGFIVPTTYYNINIARSSLAVAAAILDAVATMGFTSAALALGGFLKQGISRLNPRSGEYCCLIQCVKLNSATRAVSPEAVKGVIHGRPCPFVKLNCRLMRKNICNASKKDIAELFVELEDKGALKHSDDRWTLPL